MSATLYCLSLILYMEASIENDFTKRLVASTAIERAKVEKKPLCESMKKPKTYSWMWDGRSTKIDKKYLIEKIKPIAEKELQHPTISGRIYFNECSSSKTGRRFKTNAALIKSGKLCFY